MTRLKNAIDVESIPIDNRISSKINIMMTIDIKKHIRLLFQTAFILIAGQLADDGLLENIPRCNCIITGSDEVVYICDDIEFAGYHINSVIYPVHRWIKMGIKDIHILQTIIEEFTHMYWNIDDEIQVCYKIFEIIKRYNPKLRMSELYDATWIKNNLK